MILRLLTPKLASTAPRQGSDCSQAAMLGPEQLSNAARIEPLEIQHRSSIGQRPIPALPNNLTAFQPARPVPPTVCVLMSKRT